MNLKTSVEHVKQQSHVCREWLWGFVVKNYFLLLAVILLLMQRENVGLIITTNKNLLPLLLMPLFSLIWYYKRFIDPQKADSFINASAVLFVAFTFSLNVTLTKTDIINQITATNLINCQIAQQLGRGVNDAGQPMDGVGLDLYLTDIYEQNVGAIVMEYPTSTASGILGALGNMRAANQLIVMTQQEPVPQIAEIFAERKRQIVNISNLIGSSKVCNANLPLR